MIKLIRKCKYVEAFVLLVFIPVMFIGDVLNATFDGLVEAFDSLERNFRHSIRLTRWTMEHIKERFTGTSEE